MENVLIVGAAVLALIGLGIMALKNKLDTIHLEIIQLREEFDEIINPRPDDN
jgi:hypothetical protein